MSRLADLVKDWFEADAWQFRHLARNLLLDSPALHRPEHPDLAECGDRLTPEAAELLESLAPELSAELAQLESDFGEPDEIWMRMRRKLEREALTLRLRTPEPFTGREGEAVMVRYVSCRVLDRYWLYPSSPAPISGSEAAPIRERIAAILDQPRRMQELNAGAARPTGEPLWLVGTGRIVWVTEDTPELPHLRPGVQDVGGHERALATVRLMGLPRYDGPEARRRAVGLIAASYRLDAASLRIPNALTALDSPYFFPGYKRESCGRVASFDDDMNSPWQRTPENSTIREWIHENLTLEAAQPTVELVGFFDD